LTVLSQVVYVLSSYEGLVAGNRSETLLSSGDVDVHHR
jgi:hypothetical protein